MLHQNMAVISDKQMEYLQSKALVENQKTNFSFLEFPFYLCQVNYIKQFEDFVCGSHAKIVYKY